MGFLPIPWGRPGISTDPEKDHKDPESDQKRSFLAVFFWKILSKIIQDFWGIVGRLRGISAAAAGSPIVFCFRVPFNRQFNRVVNSIEAFRLANQTERFSGILVGFFFQNDPFGSFVMFAGSSWDSLRDSLTFCNVPVGFSRGGGGFTLKDLEGSLRDPFNSRIHLTINQVNTDLIKELTPVGPMQANCYGKKWSAPSHPRGVKRRTSSFVKKLTKGNPRYTN